MADPDGNQDQRDVAGRLVRDRFQSQGMDDSRAAPQRKEGRGKAAGGSAVGSMHGDFVGYREAGRPRGTDLLQSGSTAWPEYPERHHRAAWPSLRRSWFPVNV